eukprot:5252634-Prorocentrum_lima.AAC.1
MPLSLQPWSVAPVLQALPTFPVLMQECLDPKVVAVLPVAHSTSVLYCYLILSQTSPNHD